MPALATLQTYVLKLSKSGGEGDKIFLLMESGARFHTTQVWGSPDCTPSFGWLWTYGVSLLKTTQMQPRTLCVVMPWLVAGCREAVLVCAQGGGVRGGGMCVRGI